jgi:hypothetical protein
MTTHEAVFETDAIQFKHLHQLKWAETHIKEALSGCRYLLSGVVIANELNNCIYTGIITAYVRPFGKNNGIGKLDDKFNSFESKKMKSLHDLIRFSRDSIYAHKDLNKERRHLSAAYLESRFQDISLTVKISGETTWELHGPVMPNDYLPDIASLCEYQIERLSDESNLLLYHVLPREPMNVGNYIIKAKV